MSGRLPACPPTPGMVEISTVGRHGDRPDPKVEVLSPWGMMIEEGRDDTAGPCESLRIEGGRRSERAKAEWDEGVRRRCRARGKVRVQWSTQSMDCAILPPS